jgi:Phosphotransferase enzyme family
MFSPPDPQTETRMLEARDFAAFGFAVHPATGRIVWGWRGRTVGCEVGTEQGRAWLRVQTAPLGKGNGRIWDGTLTASQLIPASVRRPKLLAWHDWTQGLFDYRAELTEFADSPVCSSDPFLRGELDLPDEWWRSLRVSLTAISGVETDRVTLSQGYLDRALPTYLEAPSLPTVPARWATVHGDCHWANLTMDGPVLLDWEGWGLAPSGYDAALLATYSVFSPNTETRVRSELAAILDTPEGRFAELTVLAELIQTTTRGDNLDEEHTLRERARHLLRIGSGPGTGIAAFRARSSSTAYAPSQEI